MKPLRACQQEILIFLEKLVPAGMLLGNQNFWGRNEAPAGTLAGNPDFSGRKKSPCGHVVGQSGLWGENEAPAGMLAGNPDFSWREIQSRCHSNRCLFGCGHKILDFWGWQPTIFGIDIKIGNFEPKSIFWEWF